MSNLQTSYYHFKLDFQKSGPTCRMQVHGTKRCKDNQLQSLALTCKKS